MNTCPQRILLVMKTNPTKEWSHQDIKDVLKNDNNGRVTEALQSLSKRGKIQRIGICNRTCRWKLIQETT